MEVRYGISIIIAVTVAISFFAIFAGCNASHPEFDFNGNGAYSIPKQCEEYDTAQGYNSCIDRKQDREYVCANYFWWLRY